MAPAICGAGRFGTIRTVATASLFAWLAGLYPGAFAQELPEVVVTASRFEDDPRRSLADISVIGRDAVERAGPASVAELLQSYGVEIAQAGGRGSTTGLFLRGTKTSQSVVLVDGVRLQNPTSGGSNLEFLPLVAVDRIEILRGLSSPLYGSGAIGGVVNILTRRAAAAPAPRASLGLGTLGTVQGTLGYGGAVGPAGRATRFDVGVGWDRTDGFEATRPYSPDHQVDRDGNRQATMNLSLSQQFGQDWSAGVDGFATSGNTAYDGAFSSPDAAIIDYRTRAGSAWVQGNLAPGLSTQLRAGGSAIDYTYPAFDFAPRTDTRSVTWLSALQTSAGRFTAGLEREVLTIAGTGLTTGEFAYSQDRRTTTSVLAGWQIEFGAQQLNLQLRHDSIDTVDDATTGNVAWGLQLDPQWRVRASYGTAFRAPTFDDLYNPFGSNPALKPEEARGGEVGLDWTRGAARIGATLFASRIRNAIELDANFIPNNLAEARVKGLGINAYYPVGALALRSTLTFQQPRGVITDPATGVTAEAPLARRAAQSGVVGADWRSGPLTLWSEVTFQSDRLDTRRQPMGGYGVVNLGAGYAVSREWAVSLRLANAGDKDYQTVWGYNMPPRTVWLAVRYGAN